jgi:mevalonate kinase
MAPVEVNGRRNYASAQKFSGYPRLYFKGEPLGAATLKPDGTRQGNEVWFPLLEVAQRVFEKTGFKLNAPILASREFGGAPKGTGNSASVSAAFALALFEYCGHSPSRDALFDAAFVGDNAWHGGRASGGDVAAVLSDCALELHKEFDAAAPNGFRMVYENACLSLPEGTALALVSSMEKSGRSGNTAQLTVVWRDSHGIRCSAAELSAGERKRATREYDEVAAEIKKELNPKGDSKRLGELLNKNHSLLARDGVSTPQIESIRAIAKTNGALGAKLIGAGGLGGAVIILSKENAQTQILRAVRKAGYESFELKFAEKGACLESKE